MESWSWSYWRPPCMCCQQNPFFSEHEEGNQINQSNPRKCVHLYKHTHTYEYHRTARTAISRSLSCKNTQLTQKYLNVVSPNRKLHPTQLHVGVTKNEPHLHHAERAGREQKEHWDYNLGTDSTGFGVGFLLVSFFASTPGFTTAWKGKRTELEALCGC